MISAFSKFNAFVEDIASKAVHNLKTGTTDVFKIMLTNVAPVATNSVKADLTEIAAGNGYTAGGAAAGAVTGAQTAGVFKFTLAGDPVFTPAGGNMGPYRYAVLYNDSSPAKSLIGFWDYGSSITSGVGEPFIVDLDQAAGILTIT
jgi:hypothetical protein